ncbi:hypothetical protein GCK32_019549, partial [Trichostrongylus colubriformis]
MTSTRAVAVILIAASFAAVESGDPEQLTCEHGKGASSNPEKAKPGEICYIEVLSPCNVTSDATYGTMGMTAK